MQLAFNIKEAAHIVAAFLLLKCRGAVFPDVPVASEKPVGVMPTGGSRKIGIP